MTKALALTTLLLASAMSGLANDESNRVWIVGLTNGQVVSGAVLFPVKFAVTNKDTIVGVAVYDTNGPLIGAGAFPDRNGRWFLNWNTQMSFNGNYAVQAELDFASDDEVVSPPISVTVNNLFSFPNEISQMFGSHMWIYFQTVPGASVRIDIYGQDTNYLGSFRPTSDTNGVVSFLWDLTDGNGHRFKDTSFGGVFTLEKMPAVSHPVSKPNLRITSMPPYLRLQKPNGKRAVESGPTTNDTYQVVCRWYGRGQ